MYHIKEILGVLHKTKYFEAYRYIISRTKKMIDKSLVPELKDIDIEEKFIKGGGPGGQKVNKSVNCVQLFHKPTGLNVKVHQFREQHLNRKLAREKLITKLDNLINGLNSVENQIKQIEYEKKKNKMYKQKKLQEKKNNWKEIINSVKE